jgi:hypothetical protein
MGDAKVQSFLDGIDCSAVLTLAVFILSIWLLERNVNRYRTDLFIAILRTACTLSVEKLMELAAAMNLSPSRANNKCFLGVGENLHN